MTATMKIVKLAAPTKTAAAGQSKYLFESDDAGSTIKNPASRLAQYQAATKTTWLGTGALHLGLKGEVRPDQYINLLLGMSPSGHRPLVRQFGTDSTKVRGQADRPLSEDELIRIAKGKEAAISVSGYDQTFSPPKSVSTLWALSNDKTRAIIDQCILESIKESITWAEDNLELACSGKGGANKMTASLVVANFEHNTARNFNNPQRHNHSFILNICLASDGNWYRVNSRELLIWNGIMGRIFRCSLFEKLHNRLGVLATRPIVKAACGPLEKDKYAGAFEIQGVSTKLSDYWSGRRKEILKQVQLWGTVNSSTAAKQAANLATRRPKGPKLSDSELRDIWVKEAAQLGVTPAKLQESLHRNAKIDVTAAVELALQRAANLITETDSYFTRRRFLQQVLEELQGVPISGTEAIRCADVALAQSPNLVKIETERGSKRLFTTLDIWNVEQKLLEDVQDLVRTQGAVVSSAMIEKAIARKKTLEPDQANAVRSTLEQTGSIRTMTGIAGAGKTFTLEAMASAWKRQGYTVIGASLSGVATTELAAEAKIKSRVIASYVYHLDKSAGEKTQDSLWHHAKMFYFAARGWDTWKQDVPTLNNKTVLIVDEAGMVDTRTMERLVHHVKKAGATLLLVGDTQQLNAINAGGPFRSILQSVAPSHLSKNMRLTAEDAKAAADLREGKADEMLQSYAKRGLLTVTKNRIAAVNNLVDQWAKDGGIKSPKDALILVQTREEARRVNRKCQDLRRSKHQLSFLFTKVGNERIHVHDRVIFNEAFRKKGVENGHRATVTAIDHLKRTVTFRLDRKLTVMDRLRGQTNRVTLPISSIKDGAVQLGYAATVHKLQGQSVKRAYCLLGGLLTSQQLAYVSATRGKTLNRFYIDRFHAGANLKAIVSEIKKDSRKDLAHDRSHKSDLRIELDTNSKKNSTTHPTS